MFTYVLSKPAVCSARTSILTSASRCGCGTRSASWKSGVSAANRRPFPRRPRFPGSASLSQQLSLSPVCWHGLGTVTLSTSSSLLASLLLSPRPLWSPRVLSPRNSTPTSAGAPGRQLLGTALVSTTGAYLQLQRGAPSAPCAPAPRPRGGGGTGGTSRGRRALRGGAPSRRHHWDLTGPRSPRLRPATHTGALASAGQSPGRLFHLPGAVRGPSGALCRSGLLSAKVTDGGGGGGEAPGPFQWAWASRPARGTHLRTLWEAHPAFKFVIKTTSDRPHHATLNTPEPI